MDMSVIEKYPVLEIGVLVYDGFDTCKHVELAAIPPMGGDNRDVFGLHFPDQECLHIIENKLHWVRDVIFDEDASQARTGSIPHVMAALRNAAISILRFAGRTKISKTLRELADKPKLAVNLIL